MGHRILIILFVFPLRLLATTYYCSPSGNDSNNGSISEPWATWEKAIDVAQAGDTVFFRGGVYNMSEGAIIDPYYLYAQNRFGHDGEEGNPICYYAYPGEAPIFDGTNAVDNFGYLTALSLNYVNYIYFKGLIFRNFFQRGNQWWVGGIGADGCSNLRFENITIHNIAGRAFTYIGAVGDRRGYDYLPDTISEPTTVWRYMDSNYPVYIPYDSTYFINCDAYNCADTTAVQEGGTPYNMADGFKIGSTKGGYLYVENCRAWNCSDDGFDVHGSALTTFKNCWSFLNGHYPGVIDGNGIKFGFISTYDYSDIDCTYVTRVLINNITAYNLLAGFVNGIIARSAMQIYNNTAYGNEYGFIQGVQEAEGAIRENWYRNNVSYGNVADVLMEEGQYESNNTWGWCQACLGWSEVDILLTNDDFIELDSITAITQLTASRKADFSLPDITFLKLASGSDLIDAGIDVGLPYNGSAPDIGYTEYVVAEAPTPSIRTSQGSDRRVTQGSAIRVIL